MNNWMAPKVAKIISLGVEYFYRLLRQNGAMWIFLTVLILLTLTLWGFVVFEHGYMTEEEASQYMDSVETFGYGLATIIFVTPVLSMGVRRITTLRRWSDSVNERWERFGEQLP